MISRRGFLKGLGAALAVLALPKVQRVDVAPEQDSDGWHFVSGTFKGNAREVYLDGKRQGFTWAAWIRSDGSIHEVEVPVWEPREFRVAELARWDVILADDEVALLAQGVSPMLVRPDALQLYAPCYGEENEG